MIQVNIDETERNKLRITEQIGNTEEGDKDFYYDINKKINYEEDLNILDFCEEEEIKLIQVDFKVKQDVSKVLIDQIENEQSYFNFSNDKEIEEQRRKEQQQLQASRQKEVSL